MTNIYFVDKVSLIVNEHENVWDAIDEERVHYSEKTARETLLAIPILTISIRLSTKEENQMRKKTLLTLAVAATMVLSITACSGGAKSSNNEAKADTNASTSASTDETANAGTDSEANKEAAATNAGDAVKIVTIGVQSGGSYWGNIEKGFTEATEELGWEGDYWTPQNAGNDTEMVQLCENALTQGYDVVCLEINDLDMYGDFITRAKEKGVTIISLTDVGEEYCDAFVGIDSYASGYSQGEQMAKFATELGYEAINYVTLMSTTDNASQLKNREGIAAALKSGFKGEINEIDAAATDSNAATAQDKLNAYYLANPELNAVGCADLYGALGAAQFVSENGLQGKFIATGLELTADAFGRVKDGDFMATSSVDSVGIGKNFCYVAQKILNKEEFEYKNPAEKIWVFEDGVDKYCEENGIEQNK